VKILLTGANGFIGSAFWKLAMGRGHEVAGLIRPSHSPGISEIAGKTPEWLVGTLENPPWDQIRKFKPDVCVHAAWITTPGIYLESPENERFRDASVSFLRRVNELGTDYLVGLGTCIEYEITGSRLSEQETPLQPTTLYARCKNELRIALEAEASEKYDFCWGRVFYPYGPGEHPARLCSSLFARLSRNEKVVLKTPASRKDYIFIKDLAAAILCTVERRFTGAINWGTGTGISVRQIADAIADRVGRRELVTEAEEQNPDPLDFVVADATRLRSLGWQPEFSLATGVAEFSQNPDFSKA
jgi:Nucleoside-diphosphate-sugar epimerases